MNRRAAVLLAVPALALAACGGSDEDDIKDIVKEVGTDPASLCNEYATDALLKQAGGEEGCLELAKSPGAKDDTAEATSVEVDGDKATVKIKGQSGENTAEFVKVDGDWKVNSSG